MKFNKYLQRFILLLSLASILYASQLSAQTITTITIKSGEEFTAVFKQMYRFPQFTYGKVYFMNKDSAKGKLNYNLVMGKMQFIDKKGDTLVLSDNNPIRLVAIDTNLFYCNTGECVELIAGLPSAELVVANHLKFADEQKVGAYGLPTSSQSIENTNSFKTNDYSLRLDKDLIFTKETQYYLIDGNKHFMAVTKKNLQKLLPKQKNVIENYLKDNEVNFKNGSDLKNLFSYLAKTYWD